MSKLISLLMAAGFSFLIFVGMTYLVKPKNQQRVLEQPKSFINLWYDLVDTPPNVIVRLPEEPKLAEQPTKVLTESDVDTIKPDVSPQWDRPKLSDGLKFGDFELPNLMGGKSGSPGPKVRIHPRYPTVAATNGIEGYVTMAFDISLLGTTENIRVIDASPKGIFEREARRALRKWKYSPKMQNEKAIAQLGQQITLEFRLEAD